MKRICAWCGQELNREGSAATPPGNEPITHGICPDCVRTVFRNEAIAMSEFLNQFPLPVLLVDHDVRVLAANRAGLHALNRKAEEVEGRLAGEVISCEHARQPEGCGRTVHCKYCTIRKTVTDTYKTGKSHVGVPAYPDLHHITKERIRFLISTEKVGEAVLLRIDEIG
ncbi:MAG: PAS domain-containing protein [Thermodesulfobacteriota bacterium]